MSETRALSVALARSLVVTDFVRGSTIYGGSPDDGSSALDGLISSALQILCLSRLWQFGCGQSPGRR